ncbi:MAG: sugar transferase [Gemmatimonadota bacterium]
MARSARESRRRAAFRERARRVLNVAAASTLLLLTAPLMVLVAVLVKLTSPGPIIFTQLRVGLDRRERERDWHTVVDGPGRARRRVDYGGRLFRIYKFRTMRVAEAAPQVWATPDDPRITPVGRILRKYRLDELPQLFNVLRGDMNLVGPRPEQPDIAVALRARLPRYNGRHRVLPGITGWAQVNHSYDQSLDDVRRKIHLDLEYIEQRSAGQDLRIMLRTIPVMLLRRGSI